VSDEASVSSNGCSRARFFFAGCCCQLVAIAAAGSRMTWDVLDQVFIELQQIRQYDVSYQQDIGQNLSSADSTLTIVQGMRGFSCASKFVKLVTWQCTPAFVIERDVWGALEIL